MTTTTLERRNTAAPDAAPRDRDVWSCENCQADSSALRKRCSDCGTSRY